MNGKTITKLLAATLAFILTFANVAVLGITTQEAFAMSAELEEQDTAVNKASMEFDAYFIEEGEETHSKKVNIAENNEKLYLRINLAEGYLTDAKIGLQNSNFKLVETEEEIAYVESIDAENGIVKLNKINSDESVVIELPIMMNTDSNFDVQKFNSPSNIILEGTYVNTKGKEREISKEIQVYAGIKAEAEAELSQEINKYVQFDINGEKGVVLQTSIKSNLKDNILPVKQTELVIETPKINEVEPTSVVISAISTKATNDGEEKVFTSDEYTYEDGIITLLLQNQEKEDGTVSWVKDSADEIMVTYIYDEKAITETAEVELNVSSNIQKYDSEEEITSQNISEVVTLEEEIGEIVSYDIELNEEKLDKGYMETSGADNTIYVETITTNVGYSELVDGIMIEEETNYIDEKENNFPSKPLYTYTKITYENLVEMLGEDGYINILDENGEIISTLNKDNLEYDYENETTYIKLQTSKPIAEGIIKVENGREIKPLEYDKLQIKAFNSLKTSVTGNVKYQDTDLFKGIVSKDIALIEPKTTAEVSINKDTLSTSGENTEIEIQAVLDTSDKDKSLYKNPSITLEFPSYIEDLKGGKVGLLYEQGLQIGNIEKYKENGKVYIKVSLTGEQTEYNTSAVTNGTKLTIYGNAYVNELTPAIEDSIKVYIANEDSDRYETEVKIKYGAQNKVLTKNAIIGYDNENKEVKALEGTEVAQILPNADKKNAQVTLDVINSTDKKINNIEILGRIPSEGNTDIVSGESLNSTFTANMVDKITANMGIAPENVTVYYSTNEKASRENKNEWTTELQDLSEAKSYLIDLNDTEMPVGERVSFSYGIQIPEKIGGEKETHSTFAVYYNEVEEGENGEVTENNITKIEQSGDVVLETPPEVEQGEVKQGEVYQTIDNEEISANIILSTSGRQMAKDENVKEGQYIDYKVTITNKTNKEQSYNLEVSKGNGTFYGLKMVQRPDEDGTPALYAYNKLTDETLNYNFSLNPEETRETTFTLCVNEGKAGENLTSNVKITNDETLNETLSADNTIVDADLELGVNYAYNEEVDCSSDSSTEFLMYVKNISSEQLDNIKLSLKKPYILIFNQILAHKVKADGSEEMITLQAEDKGTTVEFEIPYLEAGAVCQIEMDFDTGSLPTGSNSQTIDLRLSSTYKNTTYQSNVYSRDIIQNKLYVTANMTGNKEDNYVEDGDEISYTIEISCSGIVDERFLNISDKLPAGLKAKSYTIIDAERK